ncbi:MAG: phospholipid carrier-dependent glycosyltransferase [Actinomycetes bacterium]
MATTGVLDPAPAPAPVAPPPTALARIREHLKPGPIGRRWVGWAGPLAVTVIAGFLRFYRLGQPRAFVFDETYYAKDAYSLLKYHYEQHFVAGADQKILDGNLDVFGPDPSYVVHPPLGKWLIALGEQIFGMTPFGWRFVVALLGTASVLIVARVVRRMTRSTLIGTIAGFLLAIDGLHLVMSRTALLDLPLSFFVLAAFAVLVIDRDHTRARLADRLDEFYDRRFGARVGLRPLLVLAGALLGAACAVKWNGLWFLAAFGLMTVAWDVSMRRAAGVRRPWLGALGKDALPAFFSVVPVALVVYLSSWWGWLSSSGGYLRNWGAENPSTHFGFVPDALRALWHYHDTAYDFHVGLDSPHDYESHPAGWLFLSRPVSFFYESPKRGEAGCLVKTCAREVVALGNPVIWWGGALALLVMVWLVVSRLDWRAAAVLVGVGAGWLPWFHYSNRTIFSFYAVAFVPFLVMAVALMLAWILGPPGSSSARRTWGAAGVASYLVLALAAFVALWPVFTAIVIPYEQWWQRLLHLNFWV